MKKYFKDISDGIFSVLGAMHLTIKHLKDARRLRTADNVQHANYFSQDIGIVTLQYPFESISVPDNGRYRLYNEIDDCIVCDKCAVVCPVNCIEIEAVKSPVPIGETSDGSVKRLYAAKFNIDMAKCCFCGLCTTVCPTECLTMTKVYDFSETDVRNMNYHFTDLSPQEAEEKRRLYDQFVKEKEEAKVSASENTASSDAVKTPSPAFKPKMAAPVSKIDEEKPLIVGNQAVQNEIIAPKPVIPRPAFKPVIKPPAASEEKKLDPEIPKQEISPSTVSKPVMKPVFKKPEPPKETTGE